VLAPPVRRNPIAVKAAGVRFSLASVVRAGGPSSRRIFDAATPGFIAVIVASGGIKTAFG